MGTFPPSCALNFKYKIQQQFNLPNYNKYSPVQNLMSYLTAYNRHRELISKPFFGIYGFMSAFNICTKDSLKWKTDLHTKKIICIICVLLLILNV